MSLNRFFISGNVTKDLDLRYLPNGRATVTYTVASNYVWYDNDGVKHEECDFLPVTTYDKQAERDAKYLSKGSPVAVEGHIRSWYQKEQRRGGFNFEATHVHYLGKSGGPRPSHTNDLAPEQDEWTRSYERAEQLGAGAAAPHGH